MPRRLLTRIAIVLGAVTLALYWWQAAVAVGEGRIFAHTNYWNAPIGTLTLLIVLAVLTPAWVWAVWRFWNWQGHKADQD